MNITSVSNIPDSDRTEMTEIKYQVAKKEGTLRGLLEEPSLKDFRYWRLVENAFPYDERWEVSHMLVLKRACQWSRMSADEVIELHVLKNKYRSKYDKIEENGLSMSSIKDIPHVHLLKGKKNGRSSSTH